MPSSLPLLGNFEKQTLKALSLKADSCKDLMTFVFLSFFFSFLKRRFNSCVSNIK